MGKDYSKLAKSQKKLGRVGFLQSNQLTTELEQTAHPDRGTALPRGCIAAAALLGCQVIPGTVGAGGVSWYPGPHPLPMHTEPQELLERDHVLLPRLGLARVLEAGLCTCALA